MAGKKLYFIIGWRPTVARLCIEKTIRTLQQPSRKIIIVFSSNNFFVDIRY